ncbi:MAG: LytTR family DNA-binding domain-containing protein [Bacteroidota bacterium]
MLTNLRNTPYPRPSWLSFIRAITGISLSIVFILVVFQPFGTANFEHPNKWLLLAGYGIVTCVAGMLLYALWGLFTSNDRLDHWSFADEISFLFVVTLGSQVACYLYWTTVFLKGFSWGALFSFLGIASAIACLPVAAYLLFVYQSYRSIRFADSITSSLPIQAAVPAILTAKEEEVIVEIIGSGKQDHIQLPLSALFFISSEDNYIIVHRYQQSKLERQMLRCTLKEAAEQIPDLRRCHRSYLINPDHLQDIQGNAARARLILGDSVAEVPLSRSYYSDFKNLLLNT